MGWEWEEEQTRYLDSRFAAVAQRFEATTRYVALDRRNAEAFSYEFASLLRDAGGVFGSVMDAIVRGDGNEHWRKKGHPQFPDFRKYICDQRELAHYIVVDVAGLGLLYPFEEFDPATNPTVKCREPRWWDAYNAVKHREALGVTQGNMENALTALAAVAVLVSGWVGPWNLRSHALKGTLLWRVFEVDDVQHRRAFDGPGSAAVVGMTE